jgi:Lrp/AsnC family leucine-responsive transcriptional regulator
MAVLCQIIHRMDRLDKKILAVLQANARASLQEIGQAVGLSPSPCWSRIKKMEDSGVIEGYTVRLNPLTCRRNSARHRLQA